MLIEYAIFPFPVLLDFCDFFKYTLSLIMGVHMCVQYPQKPEEGVTFPGAGGTAGYEPPDASSGC